MLLRACPYCESPNVVGAKFCNDCGSKLNPNRARPDARGRARLHTDIAHPINPKCRETMEATILEAFHAELERSKAPGYVAPDLDDFDYESDGADPHQHPRHDEPGHASRP